MAIPALRFDGYLPEGVHTADMGEVFQRFGLVSSRRKVLYKILHRWMILARNVGATRLLIDGSFVTSKAEPNDIDVVVQVTFRYHSLVSQRDQCALELKAAIDSRQPKEIFAADDDVEWSDWVELFGRTREFNRVRKGVIEVIL